MSLLGRLDRAAASSVDFLFLPSGDASDFSSIWSQAGRLASTLEARVPADGRVALALHNDRQSIVNLLAIWRAGRTAVSVPPLASPHSLRLAEPLGVLDYRLNPALLEAGGRKANDLVRLVQLADDTCDHVSTSAGGNLIQFTSGSSADPSAVVLSLVALEACIDATLERLQPGAREVVCSWLPLAHDMGLIGMLLAAICGMADHGGRIVLIETEHFVRRPYVWMDVCSEVGATITAASPTALDVCLHWLGRRPMPNGLGSLHTCIVGSELIRPSSLDDFGRALEEVGGTRRALTPAYGLAEMGLTVTMSYPRAEFRTIDLGPWVACLETEPISKRGFVSCGTPVHGARLTVDGVTGEALVSGLGQMDGYLGSDSPASFPHHTGDRGVLVEGEWAPMGRADDFLTIDGREFYLPPVEDDVASMCNAKRNCVAIGLHDDRLLVVVEPRRSSASPKALTEYVAHCFGNRMATMVALPRGAFPLTASGKRRRGAALRLARDMPTREAW